MVTEGYERRARDREGPSVLCIFGKRAANRSDVRPRGRSMQRRGAGLMAVLLVAGGAFLWSGSHARAGFGGATTYALPASETVMIKADFNGDGKTDLALLGADLLIYLGNGDGTFTAEAPIPLPSSFDYGGNGGHILAGDFNGDGKLDLVISGWETPIGPDNGGVWLMTGKGDGTFNAATLVESTTVGSPAIAAGDFNGDGKLDLAYELTYNSLSVVYGNGNGTFTTGYTTYVNAQMTGGIAVADFDHDGKDDIAVGTVSGIQAAVSVIRCEGTCVASYPVGLDGYPPNTSELVAADLNGDGSIDIAAPSGWLWGNATGGGFFPAGYFSLLGNPGAITTAAIDSDGSIDLVMAGTDAGSGYVRTMHYLTVVNGDSGIVPATQFAGLDDPLGIVSGNFNGDGLADIAEFNSTTLSITLGNHQPSAPNTVTAVAGIGSAMVSWTPALDDGGSTITGYEVISSDGSTFTVAGNVTEIDIYGLDTTAYTFTVIASNKFVASLSSAPSNAVDPLPGGTSNPLTPSRILDTRTSNGGHDYQLGPGQTLTLQVAGRGGVPSSDVTAVVLNVTVTDATANSYLAVWPSGLVRPTVSNINFHPGEAIPNLVEVALGTGGQVSFFNAAGSVDVIADVEGWVGDNTNSYGQAGLFEPLPPERILDTRTSNGGHDFPLGPGQTLTLQVTGPGAVLPFTNMEAVVMNVTVANPTASSYLTVWPTGVTRPLASNLNFSADETIPNRVTVGVSSSGQVNFYNAEGYVNVIADVNGWFTGAGSTAGGSAFVGVAPTRIIDSRTSTSCAPDPAPCPIGPGVEWVEAISSGPTALVMNVTAAGSTASGYMNVFPNPSSSAWGGTPPLASDLNFSAGETIANFTTVDLGASPESGFNAMVFYNAAGRVNLIADVDGYYGPGVAGAPFSGPVTLDKSFDGRHPLIATLPLQSLRLRIVFRRA
jgi:hypothetical protein